MGRIHDMNIACAKLFGYFKEELLNRDLKVNYLMPDLFASRHDEFLRVFHGNKDPEVNNLFLKSKLIFGKHKSRYIFPIRLKTRIVPSRLNFLRKISMKKKNFLKNTFVKFILLKNKIQVGSLGALKIFGLFENETSKKSIAIIMTNPQGIITNFNSSL